MHLSESEHLRSDLRVAAEELELVAALDEEHGVGRLAFDLDHLAWCFSVQKIK